METFLAQLKRRHIYRVTAAYAVVAWVLIQLVSNVSPMLRLPDWAGTLVLVLLLVGFPVALLFAWIHQLAPESGTLARVTTGKLDWALIGALVVVIALVSYEQFVPPLSAGTTQHARVSAATEAAPAALGAISIAVLPFANLSTDPEQEFFSDGMTDEISGALAKIPDLRVVGRSSAFQFKGENKDLRAIGQALGATHLIEGSVRKAGARIRITAQLVRADNGLQVWSQNYDRALTDVFAIQEEIAEAIATSFQMTLGLKPGQTLITNRLADPKLYEQYLRGRALLRTRNNSAAAMFDTLEDLVARAPAFAPGWATLADAYRAQTNPALRSGDFKKVALLQDKAEAAARKAIQLDTSYAGGYSELATTLTRRGKWAEADDLFKQALVLDPNDPELLQGYAEFLFTLGSLKEALGVRERLSALEPLIPLYNTWTGRVMAANGQIDESIAFLKQRRGVGFEFNNTLAEAYAIKGRFAEAADTVLAINGQVDRRSVEDAARLLRAAPSKTNEPAQLPTLAAELGFVYAYVGAPERMLEYPETAAKEGNFGPMALLWRRSYAPARKTERFKALMREAGLVKYWRARGWPDLCRPMGTDDFVCD